MANESAIINPRYDEAYKQAPEQNLPVRVTMCPTCPFRPGSKYEYLREDLEASARAQESRICHSTGKNNAINKRTGFPEHICRGAREIQLEQFTALGILTEPTDEAWNDAREKYGYPRQVVKDPVKI